MMVQSFDVFRYYKRGKREMIASGLTLEQAQAHCSKEETHGATWFDGYTRAGLIPVEGVAVLVPSYKSKE